MTAAQVSQVMAGSMTLAELRRLNGKTQAQVAESMGVSRGRIGSIERDFPHIHYPVLVRYLDAIGADLMFGAGGQAFSFREIQADPEKAGSRERRLADRAGRVSL